MFSLPRTAQPLLLSFSVAFSPRSFQRAMVLLIGAIPAMGRRTVTNVLWTARSIAEGHFSSYHRLFSRASWSLWLLGKALASAVLRWVPEDQPVLVAADDTVAQHRGPKVYGKARHRDAVRSTHSMTVWKWGHKWVVLAIVVRLPFTSRRWALPVLCALYRSKEQNRAEGRRHKTPAQLARQLMAALIRWFPRRKFVFLGDGGFGSHELARFFVRHHPHATLVSRFHPDAALYTSPTRNRIGRPRVKGRKLPSPRQTVAQGKRGKHFRGRATVTWYGGSTRRVELTSDSGQWYRIGQGLVPVRWVHVRDLQGTHRDDWGYIPHAVNLFGCAMCNVRCSMSADETGRLHIAH
ncbi:MAG: IS701 family transposase [Phycisphaerales bacterium]